MYGFVYSTYCGEVGNGKRTLAIAIAPCFGTNFTTFKDSKLYWYASNEMFKDEGIGKRERFIDSETQWIIEVHKHDFFHVIVTERVKVLQTPFDDEMNNIINQKVKEAQREYRKRKESQKRLYFYDAQKGRLELYTDGTSWYNEGCRYRLDCSAFYQKIDKRWSTPKESCFILGRVRRTIGTKDGKLMDFIEPISQFKVGEDYLFEDEKRISGNTLFKMLRFSILKEKPTDVRALRIRNKMHCSVQEFLKELKTALEEGDEEKVQELYDVVYERQDCSEQKFILVKDGFGEVFEEGEELFCNVDKYLRIYYENGEDERQTAQWVYQNISRCTNKAGIYLEKREQYNFY